jgi:prevent-host-death family protein
VVEHVSAREARQRFSDLVGSVHYGGNTVIVERSGKPMAALVPLTMYERLVAEREARFQVLDRLRERLPDVDEQEVAEDVADALAAVRAERA